MIHLEGRIPAETREALAARGHIVKVAGDWSSQNVHAAMREADKGVLSGAVSPRRDTAYAIGW